MAEIRFAEWTANAHIRHAVFHALRVDKPAKQIVREPATVWEEKKALACSAKQGKPKSGSLPARLNVTHGERRIDPHSGATKIDLIHYYNIVAPLILVHLRGRPVSLLRAPDGVTGQQFFQKHQSAQTALGVRELPTSLDPAHPALLEISTRDQLLSATQMNVIEFHTWNAVKSNIMKPDRFTFDLDPGDNIAWTDVQQAAVLVCSFLSQMELDCMFKTSGGKGLHIIVPTKKNYGWDTVKGFSQAIVKHLAGTLPNHFVAKSGPGNRIGKIFIDYLRNGFGATTVAAWSLRARPGLGISVPIAWKELDQISGSAHWNLANYQARIRSAGSAARAEWARPAQNLTHPMQLLGFEPIRLKP